MTALCSVENNAAQEPVTQAEQFKRDYILIGFFCLGLTFELLSTNKKWLYCCHLLNRIEKINKFIFRLTVR